MRFRPVLCVHAQRWLPEAEAERGHGLGRQSQGELAAGCFHGGRARCHCLGRVEGVVSVAVFVGEHRGGAVPCLSAVPEGDLDLKGHGQPRVDQGEQQRVALAGGGAHQAQQLVRLSAR